MSRSSKGQPTVLPCPLPPGVLREGEWQEICDCLTRPPEKAIRRRPSAAMGTGQQCELPFRSDAIPWFDETDFGSGRFVCDEFQPGKYLHHAAGMYYVQDAGSMLALRLLEAEPSETIADLCAAPGAKASAILEIVGPGSGWLLANEPIRGRLPALEYSLARTGFPRYAVTSRDPSDLEQALPRTFDAVLVDAPCTGQTLVSRGKQNIAAFSEAQIAHSAARQRRILSHAAGMVRPGGRIVYSTCTFAFEENEGAIAEFLREHPSWTVEECAALEQWRSPIAPGGYRLWPHRDRCAGSYAVRLRCTEAPETQTGSVKQPVADVVSAPKTLRSSPWDHDDVGTLEETLIDTRGKQRFGWTNGLQKSWVEIASSGPEVSYQPASFWLPSHSLALRRDRNWTPSHTVELSDSDVLKYVQGNALPSVGLGWFVATWHQHPLGWLHSNAQRANNSLPTAARQR